MGDVAEYIREIRALANAKNAVILAHNYQIPEIQDAADYVGDSLYLSRVAASTDAEIIVFCGVHFMAESAKLLNPDKKVLIPDARAGCSLADQITAEQLVAWKKEHPDAVVVAYVNTSAAVKAESDICCTSSNAVDVVNSIPPDREILFLPDQFLGAHVQRMTGRQNMHIWMGECHVHASISPTDLRQMVAEHPKAELLIHPECGCSTSTVYLAGTGDLPAERTRLMSTGAMVEFAETTQADEALVATEVGIIHQLEKVNKHTKFIPINPRASCQFMKMITPEKLLRALREEVDEVLVPENIAIRARASVERMIEIGVSLAGAE